MANTLTGLIPTLYEAADIVARELCGAIPAVTIDATADMAAKDQTITFPVVPAVSTSTAITPGLYAPDSGDQVIGYDTMSISKAKMVPIRWNGEEQLSLAKGGVRSNIERDRFVQAMRTLVNEVETDILSAAYKGASRAYGTAGTTPFGSSIADAAQVSKILDDNGCPKGDRSLIIDTTAGVNVRSLFQLTAQYAAGTDGTLRQGTLYPMMGLDIKESAQIAYHTKGAGTGYDIVAAGEAVGQTTLSLEGGTVNTTGITAGDVITFAGGASTDTNKYVVKTGLVTTSGDIVINNPGLLIVKDTSDELTIGSSFRANVAFHRNAIYLLARAPQMPYEGDGAEDVVYITDPLTGLVFQVAMYKQYRQVHYEVGLAWGVKVVKPEFCAILLG